MLSLQTAKKLRFFLKYTQKQKNDFSVIQELFKDGAVLNFFIINFIEPVIFFYFTALII